MKILIGGGGGIRKFFDTRKGGFEKIVGLQGEGGGGAGGKAAKILSFEFQ